MPKPTAAPTVQGVMPTRVAPFLASLVAGLAFVASCAGCVARPAAAEVLRAPDAVASLEGDWTLVMLDGQEVGDPATVGLERAPHITIADDGAAGGFAGVNRFSTRLSLEGGPDGRASFAPVMATKMAGPREAMILEERFLRALARVDAARLSEGGGRLVFLIGADEALRFERARD